MSEVSMVKLAEVLASYAHSGQKDKGGNDYILHPVEVASHLESEEAKTTALLHDILEDTFVTEETLRNLFGDKITDAVVTLTHKQGESYEEYIEKIRMNPLSTEVKLQDLKHNMNLNRIEHISEKDLIRVEKYRKAEKRLRAGK